MSRFEMKSNRKVLFRTANKTNNKARKTKPTTGGWGVERKRASEKEFISTLGIKVTVNDVE